MLTGGPPTNFQNSAVSWPCGITVISALLFLSFLLIFSAISLSEHKVHHHWDSDISTWFVFLSILSNFKIMTSHDYATFSACWVILGLQSHPDGLLHSQTLSDQNGKLINLTFMMILDSNLTRVWYWPWLWVMTELEIPSGYVTLTLSDNYGLKSHQYITDIGSMWQLWTHIQSRW